MADKPTDTTAAPDQFAPPDKIAQDGYGVRSDRNYEVWNPENNGVSRVDRYTAQLLADAGQKIKSTPKTLDNILNLQSAKAEEESLHHLRFQLGSHRELTQDDINDIYNKKGLVAAAKAEAADAMPVSIKGWEGFTGAFAHQAASWNSMGLTDVGEALQGNRGQEREFAQNDSRHWVGGLLGAGFGIATNPLYYAGAPAATASRLLLRKMAADGAEVTALAAAKTQAVRNSLKYITNVFATGAAHGMAANAVSQQAETTEEKQKRGDDEHSTGEIAPWQVGASGLIDGIFSVAGDQVGEHVLQPAVRGSKWLGSKALDQARKAYTAVEDKIITKFTAKTAEEIAAGEAAAAKPYLSKRKVTTHGGGVKTVDQEDIAREIVTAVQNGVPAEVATQNAAVKAAKKGREARGKVSVTKTRVKKDTEFNGVTNTSTDSAIDAAGGKSSQTITEGGKSQVTNTEKRVQKSKGNTLEFEGMPPPNPDGIHPTEPGASPNSGPSGPSAPTAPEPPKYHDMTEEELLKHVEDVGGMEHPDAKDALRELKAREEDEGEIKAGIDAAAEHFDGTPHKDTIINADPIGNEPLTWHFPKDATPEEAKRMIGDWYEKLLSPEDNLMHKAAQQMAAEYRKTGEQALHEQWSAINAYLTRKYPRKMLDAVDGGQVQPGFRDLSNAYRRYNGYTEGGELTKVTGRVPRESGGKVPPRGPNAPPPISPEQPWTTNESRKAESQTTDTRTKTEETFNYPKPKPFSRNKVETIRVTGKVKPHFSKAGLMAGLTAGKLLSTIGMPAVGHLIGPAIAADYLVAALINNRKAAGAFYLKLGSNTATGVGKLLKYTLRLDHKDVQDAVSSRVSGMKLNYSKPEEIDYDYKRKFSGVTNAHVDPQKVQAVLEHHVGELMPQSQFQQVLMSSLAAAEALQASHLKDPRPPTMQETPYNPPRSAKLKALKDYHAVTYPVEALHHPTPARVALIDKVHPELMRTVRNGIIGYITKGGGKLTPQQMRNASIIMGAPITPRYEKGYIQRLQMGASDKPQQDQTAGASAGKPPSINGGKSAKIAAQSALIDSPDPNVNTLQ